MGRIVNFFAEQAEKHGLNVNDPNHWILQRLGIVGTSAGVNVTAATALSTSAVFACVRVIAETIASLPLKIYERDGDARKPDPAHPLYALLNSTGPNPWQTAPEFWEMMLGHNVLRGNAYAFKVVDGNRKLLGLVPLDPSCIEVDAKGNGIEQAEITYTYNTAEKKRVQIPFDDIWHLKGISSDGFVGLSPLSLAREAIGLSLAAESHGSIYFKNGAKTSGVVSYPGKLKEPAYERFKESVQEAISGENKFKVLLLEEGASWSQVGMSNEDSQFLETRQFQVEDIARIFRVPTILIGHPDKASTYASAEQFMISFVTHTIRPWLVRLEKSISKHLLSEKDRPRYFAEFKVDGLLRGDTKSRYEAYAIARQNTWMNANEIRALENMDPRAGGDIYENPNVKVKKDET